MCLRLQTIERVFADAKEKHGMRYTQRRGMRAVTAWVKLKYAAMNLEKVDKGELWQGTDDSLPQLPQQGFFDNLKAALRPPFFVI